LLHDPPRQGGAAVSLALVLADAAACVVIVGCDAALRQQVRLAGRAADIDRWGYVGVCLYSALVLRLIERRIPACDQLALTAW